MIKNSTIEHRPTESDLIQLLQQSQKSLGQPCWLSWFVLSETTGGKLTLKVTSFRNTERSHWKETQDVLVGEPEWQLLVEIANVKNELWNVRSGDINLILSMTQFESLEQLPDKRAAQQQQQTAVQVEQAPLNPFAKPNTDSLQGAVLNRMGLSQAPVADTSQQAQMGLVLAGNIKDVEIASILQAISLCKMTGRLNLNDVSQSVELYFDNGELSHANAISGLNGDEQATGDHAALSIFAWTDGTFKFQHGWKTAQRTVQRRLDGLLLEGAALQDYNSYLNQRNITQSTILFVNPAHHGMSEADFDQALKNGIPLHIGLQKQIFLALRRAQQLDKIVEDLKIPKAVWLPVIFNLLNLNLITASGLQVENKSETAFDSIYETIEIAQKALIQPESGMLSYPLFLVLSRNELARSQENGAPFCIALVEFSHNGRAPDRTALGIIAQTFDSVKRIFDVVSFTQPNQCFLLLPQSTLDEAQKMLRRFSAQLASQSSANIDMKAGVIAVPDEGSDLAGLLNKVSLYLKTSDVRNPVVSSSSSSTMIFG